MTAIALAVPAPDVASSLQQAFRTAQMAELRHAARCARFAARLDQYCATCVRTETARIRAGFAVQREREARP